MIEEKKIDWSRDYKHHTMSAPEEFRARMKDAGWEDWEIEDEMALYEWAEQRNAETTKKCMEEYNNTVRANQLDFVGVEPAAIEGHETYKVMYGNTPIDITVPTEASFDYTAVKYGEIVLLAHKQIHAKAHESISLRLDENCQIVDARLNGSEGPQFERLRRITGYLVGDSGRFNDAKAAEVRERVKHGVRSDDVKHGSGHAEATLSAQTKPAKPTMAAKSR